MNINKIIGYSLLLIGSVIIILVLWQSYNIFSGKTLAPEVFRLQTIQKKDSSSTSSDIQKQLDEAVAQQLGKMIPEDMMPKVMNLISWSVLSGILILGGSALAGIGVKLIK